MNMVSTYACDLHTADATDSIEVYRQQPQVHDETNEGVLLLPICQRME